MKTAWDKLTLMRFVQPGDDYALTPLRLLAGIAAFGLLLFGPHLLALGMA